MTVLKKAALSLLISVLLSTVLSVLAYTRLFSFLELRFYNPSIISSLNRELSQDSQSLDSFLSFQQTRFSNALSALSPHDMPDYEVIVSQSVEPGSFIFDQEGGRILVSLPIHVSNDDFGRTALFSLSVHALAEHLAIDGRIKAGENVTVISNPPGILIGRPDYSGVHLFSQVASLWNQGIMFPVDIESLIPMSLISARTGQGFFIGRLINKNIFSLPETIRIILILSFFLTVFLSAFLLFNYRQDPIIILQTRLWQLRVSLYEHFYERKSNMDWSRELELSREKFRVKLYRGIIVRDKDKLNDIDVLFDKFWDDFLMIMSGGGLSGINEEKLKTIFTDALQGVIENKLEQKDDVIEILDELEAIDELEEAEPVEQLEALEELEGAEAVEELEELEELEEAELIEEIGEKQGPPPQIDLAEIASLIEFGETSKAEEDEEDFLLQEDLEIASPFSGMFSKKSKEKDSQDEPESGDLESLLSHQGLSVIHKPFHTPAQPNLQTLEAMPGEDDIPVLEEITDDAIEERNGVHYIKKSAMDTQAQGLNKDFKELVDSVIH